MSASDLINSSLTYLVIYDANIIHVEEHTKLNGLGLIEISDNTTNYPI